MNKKGFTLAELLITVAIIAVLIAIAIPIFNGQLEKSREAYDVYTMRQAASVVTEFVYQGEVNEQTSNTLGLKWWKNGGGYDNAAGVYNPSTGTFSPISSKDAKKGYGKGTKQDSKAKYLFGKSREMYSPKEDYTNAVVMVAVYPSGHIDVYWKDVKTGKYVGGQTTNANDPKYSIRIDF